MYRLFPACLLFVALAQTGLCDQQAVLSRATTGHTGTITLQVNPSQMLLGVAILHLDVPDGASVEINGHPMSSWTWSRYRHYHIHGVRLTERSPIKVKVTLVRDRPECRQNIYECTKEIHVMSGDRQTLRFAAGDFTFVCAGVGEQCDGCDATHEAGSTGEHTDNGEEEAGESAPTEPPPPAAEPSEKTQDPSPGEDPRFRFSTVNGQPVLCTIWMKPGEPDHPPEIYSISFQPSKIRLTAEKALRFDAIKPRQAKLVAYLQVLKPHSNTPSGDTAYPFAPIQLRSVDIAFDEAQNALLQLSPSNEPRENTAGEAATTSSKQLAEDTTEGVMTLDGRLRMAIRNYFDESLFDAISPGDPRVRLIARLGGKVVVEGREFLIEEHLELRIGLERDWLMSVPVGSTP